MTRREYLKEIQMAGRCLDRDMEALGQTREQNGGRNCLPALQQKLDQAEVDAIARYKSRVATARAAIGYSPWKDTPQQPERETGEPFVRGRRL